MFKFTRTKIQNFAQAACSLVDTIWKGIKAGWPAAQNRESKVHSLSASTWRQAGVKMSAPESPVGRFPTRLLPRAVGHPRKLNCHLSGSSLTLTRIVGREWKCINPGGGRWNFCGSPTVCLRWWNNRFWTPLSNVPKSVINEKLIGNDFRWHLDLQKRSCGSRDTKPRIFTTYLVTQDSKRGSPIISGFI